MFTSRNSNNSKIYIYFFTIILLHGIIILVSCNSHSSSFGHRIRKRQQADGDEDYEEERLCPKGEFDCESGDKCIDIRSVCDNVNDCTDKSDESASLCGVETNITCSMDISRTTRVSCEFKGSSANVTCGEQITPWTKVKVDCNKGFVPKENETWIGESICQDNGQWSHPIPVCEYDCGKITTREIDYENGTIKTYTHYPWTAFMYRRTGDDYYLIQGCLGVLITPFSVVTTHNCTVYDSKIDEKEIQEKDLIIGLGKLFPYFLDTRDEATAQKIEVERIRRISKDGQGSYEIGLNKEFQIVIIDLKTQVDYSEYVLPACFDIKNQFQLTSTSVAHAMVEYVDPVELVHKNKVLRKHSFKYSSYDDCKQTIWDEFNKEDVGEENLKDYVDNRIKNFMNENSFCVFPLKGVENETDDPLQSYSGLGSGLTSIFNGKHYVIGLFKGTFVKEVDERSTDIAVSVIDLKADSHRKYIEEAIETVKNYRLFQYSEKCVIPFSAGTLYTKYPCQDSKSCTELSTYKIMDANTPLFISCKENFTIEGECKFKACSRGSWIPEQEACIRLCDPLPKLVNVTTECTYKGEVVSCYNLVKNGTVATSYCRTQDQNTDSLEHINTCQDNGQWRTPPSFMSTICIHKCGILRKDTPLIEAGVIGKVKEHPWFSAIYYVNVTSNTTTDKDNKTNVNNYTIGYICGGTLITRLSVLSAAHCAVTSKGRKLIPSKLFRIGLGKFHRDYESNKEEEVHHHLVEQVYFPEEYIGNSLHFYHDIAIFELSKPARITNLVIPACIDMNNIYTIQPGSYGEVVGFGRDSPRGDLTTNLMKATLPLIHRDKCTPHINAEDAHLTKDKFCAFFEPGESYNVSFSTVRQGDSGSGLTFNKRRRYYVYGIVSLQTYDLVSMFTNVTHEYNLNFISNIIQIISKKRGSALD